MAMVRGRMLYIDAWGLHTVITHRILVFWVLVFFVLFPSDPKD